MLTGGAGADVFVFDVFDGGIDRITDFGAGDAIQVVGGGTVSFDATSGALPLGAVQFAVLNAWSGFVTPTWQQIA